MNADGDGPTLRLTGIIEPAGLSMEWTLGAMTGGPDDKFIFLDSDGEPRLIVSADELVELRDRAADEILGGNSA